MDRPPDNATNESEAAMRELLGRPLTEEELRDHLAVVAQPMDDQQRETRSLMIVALGDELLALPADGVVRVTEEVPVHRIPHRTSEVIRGLCNIDGELVLTAALDRLLQVGVRPDDGPDADPARRRTVVIGEEGAHWAFVVDAVLVVDRFDVESLRALPVTVERAVEHYAEALVPVGDSQAAVLDPARLRTGLEEALS
jgi:chemotaxis-related protein WspD